MFYRPRLVSYRRVSLRLLLVLLFAGINLNCDRVDVPVPNSPPQIKSDTILPKDIFIILGRGSCCSGHIISVDRDGKLVYIVGRYQMSNQNGVGMRVPETEKFDVRKITADPVHPHKVVVLQRDVTDRLTKMLNEPEKLQFFDERYIKDAYNLTIYLNDELVVSGFDIDRSGFPDRLNEFIKLLFEQVKMYDLGGMA